MTLRHMMFLLGGALGGSLLPFLFVAMVSVARRADDAEDIGQAVLKLNGSRALNRALTEENERLQAELSKLSALRRDGGSSRFII